MTPEQAVRAMTKPERVEYLTAHGWNRTESHGAQAWVSPDGREMGTLAYSVRRVLGVDLPPTFGAWLRDQAGRDDPVGDLARDYRSRCLCWRCSGLVPKSQSGYDKIQRAVLHLRRSGRIPWSWIVDTHRWMRKPTTWGSLDQMLESAAASYRRALWDDSPVAVEVWCESESVAGVLNPITAKWDVPLYPIKGQTSDSFAYGAAQLYKDDPRSLVVFYVGDHDPHGYEIESNLRAKLIEFSGRKDIDWSRLAVEASDVERLNLTGTTAKKDSYIDAMTGQKVLWTGPAVEVEAIQPPTLRAWLEDWIGQQIDPEALRLTQIAERSERNILRAMRGQRGPVGYEDGAVPDDY